MSRLDEQALIESLLDQLGAEAAHTARAAIRSQTLQAALAFEKISFRWGRLFVPHYWAIYQHDGRGVVLPVVKRLLVWFVDPKDDPRLRGGYPVRLADVPRLTKDEFEFGWERNRQMFQSNPAAGKQQYMRAALASGPTAPSKSYPFFTKGMVEFPARAARIVEKFFDSLVRPFTGIERDSVTLQL